MTTRTVQTGLVIESLERLNLSVNGNPRFRVTFTSGLVADTKSDAAIGYELDNPEFRNVPLVVTFTRAGRIARAAPAPPCTGRHPDWGTPCIAYAHDTGDHRDRYGHTWRNTAEGYCAACQVTAHDTCGMVLGCPCCDDTFRQLAE